MPDLNKVTLVGRIGNDPVPRTTRDGATWVTFSVATHEQSRWAVDHTEWHRVVAFGKDAKYIEKNYAKGQKIHLEGRLRTRKWVDQYSTTRYCTEVVVSEVLPEQVEAPSAPSDDYDGWVCDDEDYPTPF